jgi:hypothetical protein
MQPTVTGTRVYKMRGWQRGLFLFFGALMGALALLIFVQFSQKSPEGGPPVVIALLPLAGCIYFLTVVMRSRLLIDKTHLEVRGPFSERYAELSDVEGFRTISTRNGSFWRLFLKNGASITIQKWFDCDELREWFKQIDDLDERDRTAMLDEIKEAQTLGLTPDERMNALKQAGHMNLVVSSAAIAAAFAFFFSEGIAHIAAAVVLTLTPVMVLFLLNSDPLLYAIGKPKRDPRTDLTIAVLASGFGLVLGGVSVHFASYKPLLEWGALVLTLFVFAFWTGAKKSPNTQSLFLILVIYGAMYAFGLVIVADTLLDRSQPSTFATTVVGEHVVHGKSTTYYLDLAPWGPYDRENKMSVGHREYSSAQIGEAVCLSLHSGYLHAPWYKRVACGDRFVVGPE